MSRYIPMEVSIDLDDLANNIHTYARRHAMAFVLRLDEEMSDLHWTIELRDALNEVIAIEGGDLGAS